MALRLQPLLPDRATQKHMTEVKMDSGETIVTDLPAEAVADLQAAPEPTTDPAKPAETQTPPVEAPKTEEPAPAPAVEPAKEPEGSPPPVTERPKKATPFQTLLDKKHEAEQRAEQAEAKAKELETKIQELSQRPATAAPAKVKALAEKYGLPEEFVTEMVEAARDGVKPELPKEVTDMIAENQAAKQQEAEQTAFNKRVDGLAASLKDDLLKKPEVREKLQKLAYSTDKAPDGEPYYQKELAELYFGFVKPEVEPGKPSAESSRGGSKASDKVMDFQAIFDRDDPTEVEAMDQKTFQAYSKWMTEKQGDVRITRKR